MSRTQRATSRHNVALTAKVDHDGDVREEEICNIGLGGAMLTCATRLAIGVRVEVTFRIPTQEESIVIGAQVRWCGDGQMGLQFDGLRAKEVWALNQYLEAGQS